VITKGSLPLRSLAIDKSRGAIVQTLVASVECAKWKVDPARFFELRVPGLRLCRYGGRKKRVGRGETAGAHVPVSAASGGGWDARMVNACATA